MTERRIIPSRDKWHFRGKWNFYDRLAGTSQSAYWLVLSQWPMKIDRRLAQ